MASSVSCRRVVNLICAGWLPQDGTFESEWCACLDIERDRLHGNVIAHSSVASHSQTLAAATENCGHPDSYGLLVVEDSQ